MALYHLCLWCLVQVPIHMHTNWDSFYMEMLMRVWAVLLDFFAGKTKNAKLAQAWLSAHRQLLEDNFAVIGNERRLGRRVGCGRGFMYLFCTEIYLSA